MKKGLFLVRVMEEEEEEDETDDVSESRRDGRPGAAFRAADGRDARRRRRTEDKEEKDHTLRGRRRNRPIIPRRWSSAVPPAPFSVGRGAFPPVSERDGVRGSCRL